jgi:hypothetical protein
VRTSTNLPHATVAHLRRLASRIHKLGPRPLFELFCEIGEGEALARIETYAEIDASVVRMFGGDRFQSDTVGVH